MTSNSLDQTTTEKAAPSATEIIACGECDLLVKLTPLTHGVTASCPRCGFVLTQYRNNARQTTLAFAVAALLFLVFSLPFAFLSLDSRGTSRMVSLIESFQSIAAFDYTSLALVLFAFTVVIPGLFLVSLIYVLVSSVLRKPLPNTRATTRGIFFLLQWNMAEIFLLSILVSFIKIMTVARVGFGLSFYAYILFIASLMATISYLDRYQLWRWVSRNQTRVSRDE